MKLLFDHNLSPSLANHFSSAFPGSEHVYNIGLDRTDDIDIWNYAKSKGFVIVTRDSDFHDLGERFGYPPYIILIKRGNCPTSTIREIINNNTISIQGLENDIGYGILILF